MNNRLVVFLAALCCTVLLLSACGGDDDGDDGNGNPTSVSQETADDGEPTDSAEPTEPPDDGDEPAGFIDACSLLTTDEAAAVLGGPVDPPEQGDFAGEFSQCAWIIQGGTVGLDSSVIVQSLGGVSDDEFEEQVRDQPEELGVPEPIDGLGDMAYQQIATFVHSNGAMVVVTVLNDAPLDQQEQQQQDLARTAIGRLP